MQTAVMAQPAPGPAYGAIPVRRKPITNPAINVRPPQSYQYQQPSPPEQMGHSRSRTTSSGVFPVVSHSSPITTTTTTTTTMHQYPPGHPAGLRRTPTSSSSSTTGTPMRSNSGALRRSSSSRSSGSPTSYVALMRKQKATVWCDRSQYEDPRNLAAQRQAKMRANMEVAGGQPPRSASGGYSMGGVRSKVGRHHGVPKASLYAPQTYAGSGVPMRLSASEVDEGDNADSSSLSKTGAPYHHRTGSGRSSLGSGRRMSYNTPAGRLSSTSTPPQTSSPEDLGDLQEEETPHPSYGQDSYFEHTKTNLSTGSGSSGERHFGEVGRMPDTLPKPPMERNTTEDLVRRGSVDERTMTMGNTRLFIANPDLSD